MMGAEKPEERDSEEDKKATMRQQGMNTFASDDQGE